MVKMPQSRKDTEIFLKKDQDIIFWKYSKLSLSTDATDASENKI